MVYLSRIYTKTGDKGTTRLGDGATLPKHHPRIASYGTTDELSGVIGIALSSLGGEVEPGSETPHPLAREFGWLGQIQNDLFDVGSDLCVPGEAGEKLRIGETYVKRLEGWIDTLNETLEPLNTFVLPGGTPFAAQMHLARTVCRRAERGVCELIEIEGEGRVNPFVLQYLNRLSDLLFVMARYGNDRGKSDVLWVPGKNR